MGHGDEPGQTKYSGKRDKGRQGGSRVGGSGSALAVLGECTPPIHGYRHSRTPAGELESSDKGDGETKQGRRCQEGAKAGFQF